MANKGCIDGVINKVKNKLGPNASEADKRLAENAVIDAAGFIDAETANHPSRGNQPGLFGDGLPGQDQAFVEELAKKMKNSYEKRAAINKRTILKSAEAGAKLRVRAFNIALELNPELKRNLIDIETKLEQGETVALKVRKEEIMKELAASLPEAIETIMVGSSKVGKGLRKSVDAVSQGIEAELIGPLVRDLRKAGLLDLVKSGDLDRDIARELWGTAAGTGNDNAKKAADIIRRAQDRSVTLKNNAGAWIKKLPGYIVRQTHDFARLKKAGFERWYQDTIEKVDWSKTAPQVRTDQAGQVEIMRKIYQELLEGKHMKVSSEGFEDVLPGLSTNLAEKLSEHRGIYFKNADAWFEYNKLYGGDSLLTATTSALKKAADSVALMRTFGPNPTTTLDQVFKYLDSLARENTELEKKWTGRMKEKLLGYFEELDGTSRIPVDGGLATFGRTVRAINNLSLLGSASVSAAGDIPFFAAANVSITDGIGRGLLEGYTEALANLLRRRGKGEIRELADDIGVGLEGMLAQIIERFSPEDYLPGMWSRAQRKLFELQGLALWTDVHKTGAGLLVSKKLAREANIPWKDLPDATRIMLERYDIDEKMWSYVKDLTTEVKGKKFAKPSLAKKIEGLTPEERVDLETNIRALLIDESAAFVPTPTAKQRSATRLRTRPGTWAGEGVSFLTQFKTFPLTAVSLGILAGRTAAAKGGKMAFVEAMAHLVVATTVFGALALTAKDFIKGRSPRRLEEPGDWTKFTTAAFIQGGGAGIYGDLVYAMAETSYGSGVATTLGGPTLGMAESGLRIGREAFKLGTGEKDLDEGVVTIAKTLKRHVPFQNLLLTRMVTDEIFYKTFLDSVDPGSYDRARRKIERNYNQDTFSLFELITE